MASDSQTLPLKHERLKRMREWEKHRNFTRRLAKHFRTRCNPQHLFLFYAF